MSARITLLLLVCGVARADGDLPPELVARPATLPHGMIALTLAGGYDSAHALGIPILSATTTTLAFERGMTSRLDMSLSTGFDVHPDAGWSRDGTFALVYRAWADANLELAPSLTVPLSAKSGADLTSTIVIGAGVRWRASRCVLVVIGQRLLPLPIRPAVAFDVGLDATVIAQLAPRLAVVGEAVLGEVTIVGQTDRGFAPWHELPAALRIVYATPYALDVAAEVHGDARDPRDAAGFAILVTRRL